MNIIDRYIGGNIVRFTSISLLVLLGLFIFIDFLDQVDRLGHGNYDMLNIIKYLLLRIPGWVYELFPMAALLGTIIGLSVLANDSELVALRVSGMSIFRIIFAVLRVGGVFILIVVIVGELVTPFTETRAQRHRTVSLQQDINRSDDNLGLWLRDTNSYVSIDEVLPDLSLSRIKIIEFDNDKKLRSLVSAERGEYVGDYWRINNVKQTLLSGSGDIESVVLDTAQWRPNLSPQILATFLVDSNQLSFVRLVYYINHLRNNQQQTTRYELALWHKITLPLSTAVMVVLAIPFVFTNLRSGSLGRNIFIGIMLGIGFYAVSRGFGYVVLAQGLPPLFGAVMPPLFFLLSAVFMIRRVK